MRALMFFFRFSIIIFLFFSCISKGYSQYVEAKKIYNHKEYSYKETDKYHPTVAGVASYVLPGLGQIYCNENKRGYKFMTGYAGGLVTMMVGAAIDLPTYLAPENTDPKFTFGQGLIITGVVISATSQIWSTFDAVRVARVKNMSIRDKNKQGFSLMFRPNISLNNNAFMLTAGITF